MKPTQGDLFVQEQNRLQMTDSIALTEASLNTYAADRECVVSAWSAGKDSTCKLTVYVHLMETGRVPRPRRLIVCLADTRQELLPMYEVADDVIQDLEERGIEVRRVMAPMDERFLVYMLGYGVPPPHNRFRWCTDKLKLQPMARMMAQIRDEIGEKPLLLHGVRRGESVVRDARISLACSRDDAECGQGWYEQTLSDAVCDKLGPILHWRVCHVAAWLRDWAPQQQFGGWETAALIAAYGGEQEMEKSARTGCVGCPLVSEDRALVRVVKQPAWKYLAPLLELKALYRGLQDPTRRLRKPPGERTASGALVSKQERLGPLTMDARLWALDRVLTLQAEVNAAARAQRRPVLDLLNAEEEARIRELIAANTWPDKWDGTEPVGDRALMTLFERTREQTEADLEGDEE